MYICLVKFTGYFNVYGVITRVTIEDDRQGRATQSPARLQAYNGRNNSSMKQFAIQLQNCVKYIQKRSDNKSCLQVVTNIRTSHHRIELYGAG